MTGEKVVDLGAARAKRDRGQLIAQADVAEEGDETILALKLVAKFMNLSAYDASSLHYFSRTMLIVVLLNAVAQLAAEDPVLRKG